MKFDRIGHGMHSYSDGEHSFTIVQVYVSEVPNCKGYKIMHTGPVMVTPIGRKRKFTLEHEIDSMLNAEPINRMKDVKVQIALFLLDHAARMGASKSTDQASQAS